jgi:hypothetical protein
MKKPFGVDPLLEVLGQVALDVGDGGVGGDDVRGLTQRAPRLLPIQPPPATGLGDRSHLGQATEPGPLFGERPEHEVPVRDAAQPVLVLLLAHQAAGDPDHDVVHVVGERDRRVAA